MAKWYVRTYVRCQAFHGKFSQREKSTNCCKVFSIKNRPQIPKNRTTSLKKRKKAPKGTQERHKARGTHSSSDLGAVLGRSWGALGTPRAAPNAAKSTKIGARSEFFTFF